MDINSEDNCHGSVNFYITRRRAFRALSSRFDSHCSTMRGSRLMGQRQRHRRTSQCIILLVLVTLSRLPTPSWSLAAGSARRKSNKNASSGGGGGGGGGFGKSSNTSPARNASSKAKSRRTTTNRDRSYSFIPDTSPTIQSLLTWLDDEEVEGLGDTSVGYVSEGGDEYEPELSTNSPPLRGVFARRNFQRGEYILAVPFVSTLLVDERVHDDDDSNSDTLNRHPRADDPENGLHFMNKFFLDQVQRDKFRPYLEAIPQSTSDPNFAMTPDFWPIEYIQKIGSPQAINQILSRRKNIEQIIVNANVDAHQSEEKSIDFDSLQFAAWLVRTRAFTTFTKTIDAETGREGLMSRVIMIPYLDMLNHAPPLSSLNSDEANAELQVVETKEYDESFYALVATKAIQKNEQICITYGTGKESSIDVFVKYGFLPAWDEHQKNIDMESLTVDHGKNFDEESLLDTSIEESLMDSLLGSMEDGSIEDLEEEFVDDDEDRDDVNNNNNEDEEVLRNMSIVKSLIDLRIRMKSALLK